MMMRALGLVGLLGLAACATAPPAAPPSSPAPAPSPAPPAPAPKAETDASTSARTAASSLKTNAAGVSIIKESEALRLDSYELGTAEFIGYGHLQKAGEPDHITEAQADALLKADLATCEASIGKVVTTPVTSNEFSAMVSLCYNIGTGQFGTSSVVKQLNAGDRKAASDAFLLWNKGGGQVLDHLVKRRKEEQALFLKP